MRTHTRSLVIVVGLALLAGFANPAQATVAGVANGDFESGFTGTDLQSVPSWYDIGSGYADFVTAGTGHLYGLDNTAVLGLGSSAGGYIYQQVGTYSANELVTLAGQAYRIYPHYNSTIPGLTISLYSGAITPLNGSKPDALGATLLDSVSYTSGALGFVVGTPLNQSAENDFAVTLNEGGAGTVGAPLWLLVGAYNGDSDTQIYLDNLSASGLTVPEPGVAALLGVGALCLIARRRARQAAR